MRADANRLKIQNEDLFTNPGEIAHLQFPGQMDVHARLDIHFAADLGAEPAEQGALEHRGYRQRSKKEGVLAEIPNSFDQTGTSPIQPFTGIKQIVTNTGHAV